MPLVSFSKMEASVGILRMTSRDWDYANPAVLLAGEIVGSTCTEIQLIVRSRFGEICSCCCLIALPGPAWVLLNYVLHTILCTSVLQVCTVPLRLPD